MRKKKRVITRRPMACSEIWSIVRKMKRTFQIGP